MAMVALMALCGTAYGAISAASASAAATAWTCLSGGTGFGDADCSTAGTGFHDEEITPGTSTGFGIKATSATQVLKWAPFGAAIEVIATGVECVECMIENTLAGAEMEVKGEPVTVLGVETGEMLRYSGVTVGGALGVKCEVKGGVIKTNPLKITTNATNELTFERPAGKGVILAEFEIAAKAGKACNVAGLYKLEGKAPGALAGAVLTFNIPAASAVLKVSGKNASLTGTTTVSAGVTGAGQQPIVLT